MHGSHAGHFRQVHPPSAPDISAHGTPTEHTAFSRPADLEASNGCLTPSAAVRSSEKREVHRSAAAWCSGRRKGKEIDIVVDYPNTKNIPIEVKYREGAPIADDDAIVELCKESSAAIIITKNADDYGVHNTKCGKDLLRIPAFAFLYLLGNAEKHGYRGIEQ